MYPTLYGERERYPTLYEDCEELHERYPESYEDVQVIRHLADPEYGIDDDEGRLGLCGYPLCGLVNDPFSAEPPDGDYSFEDCDDCLGRRDAELRDQAEREVESAGRGAGGARRWTGVRRRVAWAVRRAVRARRG